MSILKGEATVNLLRKASLLKIANSHSICSFFPSQLFLNWTGNDASSGIYDYEVGLATTSAATVPDISGFESTNHHTFYKQYHPTLTEGTPFYILIKAIDKAGVEFVQV